MVTPTMLGNNYTKYDHMVFYVTMVTFQMTLHMNKWTKYCQGRWMSPSIGQNPTISNLWWNIVTDDWYLDENNLECDSNGNTVNL